MPQAFPGILRFLPSPSIATEEEIAATLRLLPEAAEVLDVGAGGRRIVPHVVAFDLSAVDGVDVVGDLHRLPFASDRFDCVISTGTLEHVRDPHQAVREMHRVLKPGGLVHIDVPFIQGYHADPTDFWRFTRDGLRVLCSAFEELESGVQIGPTCALVWVLREWADSCFGNRYLANISLCLAAFITAPLRYLDYIVARNPKRHRIASALYFRGRKPISAVVSH